MNEKDIIWDDEVSWDEQQPQPTQEQPQQGIEKQNILGQLFNVPGAAIRSAIQGKGYAQGAMNPSQVPTFQNLALDKYYQTKLKKHGKLDALDVIGGNAISAVGMIADMVTQPADVLLSLVGGLTGKTKIATAPRTMRIDSTLAQSEKSKVALEGVRKTIGEAKKVAIQEIADVPTELVNIKSPKAIKFLQDNAQVYELEFDQNGGLKQTVGNLDKIKEALGDMIGSKPQAWLEAAKKEKQLIIQSYKDIRDSVVSASKTVGKDVSKYLDDYHKFMINYNKVKKTIVDAQGQAVANKLKSAFQWKAEPAVKEAWKEVSKLSPELKRIMNSQKNRRLLKNLLMLGVAEEGVRRGSGKILKAIAP